LRVKKTKEEEKRTWKNKQGSQPGPVCFFFSPEKVRWHAWSREEKVDGIEEKSGRDGGTGERGNIEDERRRERSRRSWRSWKGGGELDLLLTETDRREAAEERENLKILRGDHIGER